MSGLLIKRVDPAVEPKGWCYLRVGRHLAKVDLDDYDSHSRYHWRPKRKKKKIYAVRRFVRNGKTYEVMLHNSIMKPPPGYEPHHKNHDTLDNRRENLENVPHDNHPHY